MISNFSEHPSRQVRSEALFADKAQVGAPAIRTEQNHVAFFRRAALHPGEPIGMPGTARPIAFGFSARKRFRAVASGGCAHANVADQGDIIPA